jgi:predicted nucleic acid-binding protein
VNRAVIDASVALKWVVEEDGTAQAFALRRQARLLAPELFVAECANILWKKVRRHELTAEEARLAAGLLQGADVELVPTRRLLVPATRLAIELDHSAYDCLYLALALENGCPFVTADRTFVQRVRAGARTDLRGKAIFLPDAVTPMP